MNTLEAFHMRCQLSATYTWCMLVGSCLECRGASAICFVKSTIGDILRHRRLSLFGHVARLDPEVPAHDAVRLIVDTYEGRKNSWRRPQGRPRNVCSGSTKFRRMPTLYYYLHCGDLRSPGVTERRGGSLGLRDDDDDDDDGWLVSKIEGKTNFSRHLQAARNRYCSMSENHWV